ncbi:cell division protein ZipA C-terminal FtsZ-binding domain-containing protein [Pseudoalteromonas tunicata]|jgi:cell division protein ZipA|uniref:Cell division protein ZipA n=1 Tax=Pseudoalteromonas tunicata D2 TaxID=87626 RepID=A4CFQ7_9GAMM|nr:cell division protein ZipA C-terminal FtsZ-binding domain-containing protein [Pseudoalteromonas tunicata]ATC94155.1 cell division protein ZipA [Pseudoalteromonas tunicata]AXT29920.1 cell division protein ZipA [Pseudoalteromonas tunicata]EAR26484.1 hypothetical protein PTD2_04836 [Pseudoalteromonas tunicata D2]MDP4982586.1 cell division protein ZipA C-terminal FtsZ-binding domain-containing protein [Pseudoalteromonas tunicata]
MADELRWVLVIISALVIGGLLLHGLWSVRKKDQQDIPETVDRDPDTQDEPAIVLNAVRDEPQMGDLGMNISARANEPALDKIDLNNLDPDDDYDIPAEETVKTEPAKDLPSDFIIVHLQMPEGLTMQGASLLPLLLTLGFKYSEEGFFNRHEDASGNGAVLFRLVNMYNPGTFDIDNMEQLSTAGVSLFMTLPCEGDSLPAFNMLHSAAKKLADEFGAQVLDHNRDPLSVTMVRQYVEKIREFDA